MIDTNNVINSVKLQELTQKAISKGNDIEMRSSKDGIKVFEVSKKIIGIIPK